MYPRIHLGSKHGPNVKTATPLNTQVHTPAMFKTWTSSGGACPSVWSDNV